MEGARRIYNFLQSDSAWNCRRWIRVRCLSAVCSVLLYWSYAETPNFHMQRSPFLSGRESVGTDEVSIEKNNALWLIRTPLLYWTLPGNGSPRMDESSSRIICRLTVVGPKIESPTSALTPLHQASINTVAHTASKINITPHQRMCVQHSTREQITALSCTGLVLLWWLKQEDLSYASLPRLVHAGFRIETNHAQCCGLCSDVG